MGDDCAFAGLVLSKAVPHLLGATCREIVWESQAPIDTHSLVGSGKARHALTIQTVENRDPASIKDVVEHYGMSSED